MLGGHRFPPQQYLLLVGNSGVGKSFIGNALLGCDTFHSSYQVNSVTRVAQSSSAVDPDGGQRWVVVDMPGLVEANADSLRSNEAEMSKAFAMANGQPVVVAFVLTLEGGRMQADQLGTVRELMSRVQGLSESNTLIVANKIDDDASQNEVRQTLWYYLPSIPRVCLVKLFRGYERRDFAALQRSAAPAIFATLRDCTSAFVVARDIKARRQADEAERAARELRAKEAELLAARRRIQQEQEEEMRRREQEAEQEARRQREEREREAAIRREELEESRRVAAADHRQRELREMVEASLAYTNNLRMSLGWRSFPQRHGTVVVINGVPYMM